MSKELTNWSIPVAKSLDNALEKAVRLSTYSTKSDFVRDSVRHKLESLGFKLKIFEK